MAILLLNFTIYADTYMFIYLLIKAKEDDTKYKHIEEMAQDEKQIP